jgi:hypothetical protein
MSTPAPKKRGCLGRSLLTVVILLIVAAVVCVGAVAVAWPAISNVVNAVAAPITASQDFMNDLIAKDYTKAYAMIHPSEQQDFGGSADGMQQTLSDQGITPTTFTFTNVQIGSDALVNGTGTFDGKTRYVYISLRKDGDAWKIIGIQVNDNAPTATPAGS